MAAILRTVILRLFARDMSLGTCFTWSSMKKSTGVNKGGVGLHIGSLYIPDYIYSLIWLSPKRIHSSISVGRPLPRLEFRISTQTHCVYFTEMPNVDLCTPVIDDLMINVKEAHIKQHKGNWLDPDVVKKVPGMLSTSYWNERAKAIVNIRQEMSVPCSLSSLVFSTLMKIVGSNMVWSNSTLTNFDGSPRTPIRHKGMFLLTHTLGISNARIEIRWTSFYRGTRRGSLPTSPYQPRKIHLLSHKFRLFYKKFNSSITNEMNTFPEYI